MYNFEIGKVQSIVLSIGSSSIPILNYCTVLYCIVYMPFFICKLLHTYMYRNAPHAIINCFVQGHSMSDHPKK